MCGSLSRRLECAVSDSNVPQPPPDPDSAERSAARMAAAGRREPPGRTAARGRPHRRRSRRHRWLASHFASADELAGRTAAPAAGRPPRRRQAGNPHRRRPVGCKPARSTRRVAAAVAAAGWVAPVTATGGRRLESGGRSPPQQPVRPKRGAATTLLIAGFATAIGPLLPWVSLFGINANAFTLGEFADGLDAAESTVTTWRVIAIGLLLGGLVCGVLGSPPARPRGRGAASA